MKKPSWCSFGCPASVTKRAGHTACMTLNEVYCGIINHYVGKGLPCKVSDEDFNAYMSRIKKQGDSV
jgi:hypothetical protein